MRTGSANGRDGSVPPLILVADDDDDSRALLCYVLTREGYDVVEARDGDEVVQCFLHSTRPCPVDLIVTDLRMPRLDGLSAFAELRASNWSIPLILVSGQLHAPDYLEAARLGVTAVMSKPVDVAQFVAAVRDRLA